MAALWRIARHPDREARADLFPLALARADAPERAAWDLWPLVERQVTMLNPNVAKAKHARWVPDAQFCATTMEWARVPRSFRPRVWRALLVLFDLEWHEGADFDICQHEDPLADYDERCPKCRVTWRCKTCEERFVVHDPCPREDEVEKPAVKSKRRRVSALQPIGFREG